jgi:hypothetical protein
MVVGKKAPKMACRCHGGARSDAGGDVGSVDAGGGDAPVWTRAVWTRAVWTRAVWTCRCGRGWCGRGGVDVGGGAPLCVPGSGRPTSMTRLHMLV